MQSDNNNRGVGWGGRWDSIILQSLFFVKNLKTLHVGKKGNKDENSFSKGFSRVPGPGYLFTNAAEFQLILLSHCFYFSFLACTSIIVGWFPLGVSHSKIMSCGYITGRYMTSYFSVCAGTDHSQRDLGTSCGWSTITAYICPLHGDLWTESMAATFYFMQPLSE